MILSKTKINTYLRCPLQFKLKYIDELEEEPNHYMILGRQVHLIAEKFLDRFKDDLEDINIKSELDKLVYEYDFNYELEIHIISLTAFFKKMFIKNKYKLYAYENYILDEENEFSGICDIILEDENGDLIIIDYKTGNSTNFTKYRLELCYYKLLVENILKRKVSQVGIFFTRDSKLRMLEIAEDDDKRHFLNSREIDDAIKTMHEVRSNIDDEIFYPNKEYTCKFCTFYELCHLW